MSDIKATSASWLHQGKPYYTNLYLLRYKHWNITILLSFIVLSCIEHVVFLVLVFEKLTGWKSMIFGPWSKYRLRYNWTNIVRKSSSDNSNPIPFMINIYKGRKKPNLNSVKANKTYSQLSGAFLQKHMTLTMTMWKSIL